MNFLFRSIAHSLSSSLFLSFKRTYLVVMKKGISRRFGFFSFLSFGFLLAACLLPFLPAFETLSGGGFLEGKVLVSNAFSFIFGLSATSKMTIGVGSVSTLVPGPSVTLWPVLLPLIGFSHALGSFLVFLLFLFFGFRGKKIHAIFLAFFMAILLIVSGILLLISGDEIVRAFLEPLGAKDPETIRAMGYRLGDGFVWSSICAFLSAISVILASFHTKPR